MGADCAAMLCGNFGTTYTDANVLVGCKTEGRSSCYGTYEVHTCTTCESGYTRTQMTETNSGCNVSYYGCKLDGGTPITPSCTTTSYSSSTCSTSQPYTISNCSSYGTDKCFNGQRVRTCTTCASGYTRTSATYTPTDCSGSYTYYRCVGSTQVEEDECETDADCAPGAWITATANTAYQYRNTYSCVNSFLTMKCMSNTVDEREYRCADNYYGVATSSYTGCSPCPNGGRTLRVGKGPGTVVSTTDTPITDCFLPAGDYSDNAGSYTIDYDDFILARCYYQL